MYAAAVTPWAAGETVDESALWRQVEMLLAAGINGICVAGTTGEFPRLERAERLRLLRATVEMVAGRVPVLFGAGDASLDATLSLVAAARGASAVMVTPPYYFPYGQAELLEFYRRAASAAELPVLLYNIPQFTTEIAPDTARELLEQRLYAGIKDSGGRPEMVNALAELRRSVPFTFLCGADEQLLHVLGLGADGALSGIASCVPELLVTLYRAFCAGDQKTAGDAQDLLREFSAQCQQFPAPIGIRLALEARGIPVGPHAVPLSAGTKTRAREFQQWLEDWLPKAINCQLKM